MAIEFGKDRAQDFAPANLMSFGKSFSRMGAQPLDMNEVWYDLDALKNYAKTNATAYVGMRLIHADSTTGKVTVYAIKNTAGDLLQIASADDIQAAIDAIVFPEDTNTTYGFAFDKTTQKITITPSEGDSIELDLSDFLIASDLPEDKNTEYHLEYSSEDKTIKLVAGADAEKMSIDATPFIKDGILSEVDYDPDTNALTFVWNTDAGFQADTVFLSDILDPYIAGDKIVIDGSKISHASIAAPALVEGGSGRTYITELVSDGFGHITGYKVATETDQEIPEYVDTNTHYELSAENDDTIDNTVNLILSNDDNNDTRNLVPITGAQLIDVKYDDESKNIIIATPGLSDGLIVNNESNKIALNLGTGLGINNEKKIVVLVPVDGHIVVNSSNELTLGALPEYETITNADGKEEKTLKTPGTGIFKDVYTKEETNDAIADAVKIATGGESASDVLLELNNYKKKVNSEVWGDESGTGITVGDQTNLSRIDIIQVQVGTLSEKLDSVEDGAEKNFISSVDETKFTVTEGKLVLNENYVTTTVYTTEVGDLTKLIRDEGRENTTLVDEINYINARLTWGEMA